MSIQNITSAPACGQARQASARTSVSGPSFQEQLAQAAGAASGGARLTKEELSSALYGAQRTMLERMKLGKEKQEEEDAWNEMMEYVDAWIESLQEEAGIEKSARAYAAVMARLSERPVERKDLGDYILERLTEQLAG